MFIRRLNNTLGGCEFSSPQWNSHRAPSLFFLRVHLQVGERETPLPGPNDWKPARNTFRPVSRARPHIKLRKLNTFTRDVFTVPHVTSQFISSYSNGMRSSKERYIIDRGSHRRQRWCNLSNNVRKCVPYTSRRITLPLSGRGPSRAARHSARSTHLRGCEIVARLVLKTSRENVIRAMEVHTPAFIYLCSVKKPSGRGEIESGCNLAGAECMTDTSCGISGRTKSLMLLLNRHKTLNDWLVETLYSLKVSQTMMIHLHSQNSSPGQIYSQWVIFFFFGYWI